MPLKDSIIALQDGSDFWAPILIQRLCSIKKVSTKYCPTALKLPPHISGTVDQQAGNQQLRIIYST